MSHSPVIEGEFSAGPEWMLWRPGLNRRRLRWLAVRSAVLAAVAILVGVTLAVYAAHDSSGPLGWMLLGLIVVLTAIKIVATAVNYCCADYDHRHTADRACRLEAVPGEFFYRARDFRDLAPSIVESVETIVAAVERVHTSPAAAWLHPAQLRDAHHVAWDLLCVLDRTRPLHDIHNDPRYTGSDELEAARSYLTALDDVIERVLTSALDTELLISGWERKLAETNLRAHLHAALDRVPRATLAAIVRRAETMPEGIFAYVTAARDVTNAGPFDWEKPPQRPTQQPRLRARHLLESGTR